MGLFIVTISDVGSGDKKFKWIILLQVKGARFNLLLELSHALLSITVE
jgi:hypothetical protein